MFDIRAFTRFLVLGTLGASASAQAPIFFGRPLHYVCRSDSPFDQSGLGVTFFLETFEDNLLNTPGVTAETGGFGHVYTGNNVDSVDCDDGSINNGSATSSHSFFANGPIGITFTFD